MKINGPNQSNFNPYKQQFNQKMDHAKKEHRNDQLEISKEAKQLMENSKSDSDRAAHIQKIKKAVDSGEYRINYEKTAQKMIDFWSES